MDITRDNFKENLPLVIESIKEASFICIDGEFTGLTNGTYNLTAYDSPDERYHKLRCNTENFLLLQFGMCTFRWNEDDEKYKIKSFNFYIFPFRSSFPGVPDRVFACQSSSLDFLTSQGFDFNKAFKKGIPFLRQNEETNVRNALVEKQAYRENSYKSPGKGNTQNQRNSGNFQSPAHKTSPTPITDQKTKDFTENVLKLVQSFMDDNKDDELMLDSCNSYLRKILFEILPQKFPDQILVESRTDDQTHLRHIVVVRGASDEVKKSRQEQTRQREETELQSSIGFSTVIKLLSESQKLIIGHNMLLDVIYTIQQFICVLPTTLDDFKSLVQCVFPKLLDTKLMGSMLPFKDHIGTTALGDMNARLREPPFHPPVIEVPGKYNIGNVESQDGNLHEAAYDAYITGTAFLSMVNFLCSFQKPVQPVTSFSSLCNTVSPYINKLFLMRSHDLPYLNLSGADLTPSRDHVFHVEFPASWRANDLRQLFSPLGQINISWINETHCLVGLYNKSQSKNVKNLIKPNTIESFRVLTYNEYQNEAGTFTTRSQNRVWNRNNVGNAATSSGLMVPVTSSLSFTSSLQAACITSSDNDTSHRKRTTSDDGSVHETCDEPVMKRQKSHEDNHDNSDNGTPLINAVRDDKSVLPIIKIDNVENNAMKNVSSSCTMFEVPDQW